MKLSSYYLFSLKTIICASLSYITVACTSDGYENTESDSTPESEEVHLLPEPTFELHDGVPSVSQAINSVHSQPNSSQYSGSIAAALPNTNAVENESNNQTEDTQGTNPVISVTSEIQSPDISTSDASSITAINSDSISNGITDENDSSEVNTIENQNSISTDNNELYSNNTESDTPIETTDLALTSDQTENNNTSVVDYLFTQNVKVFPGAEGFGTDTIAGRKGTICKVTNLHSEGIGSLRHCLEATYPRIVIFEVGGTITVDRVIQISHPFISVYGQTALGDGILLRASLESTDPPIRVSTHDVLIQHMRFRAGTSLSVSCCRDAASISNPTPGSVYNVVLDHISFSWGVDEIVDLWYDPHDITISRSIFSEGLRDNGSNSQGPSGRGLIVGSEGAHSISLHHNFFAHSYQRNPFIKVSGIVDVVNTLVYHWISWGSAINSDFATARANFVKNKYIALSDQATPEQNSSLGWGDFVLSKSNHSMEIYFEDNIGYNRPTNDLPQWQIANTFYKTPYDPTLGYHTNIRHPAPKITEIPVEDLETKLIEDVGANIPRQDTVDLRLFDELRTRTGIMPNCVDLMDMPNDSRCTVNVGGWPNMPSGQVRTDSDNDGIPDEWEISHGLNPNLHDSLEDRNGDGYLNIEDWIHSIPNQN